MKKLLRGVLLCALMGLMALALSGCGLFKSIEDLYALPALPEEYSQLQSGIQAVMDEMQAEYASINSGSYTSTIQLLDMDNNDDQETAAVFLRVINTDEGEKPLRVCLFRRGPDGTYRLAYTVTGDGSSIHSVAYEDLTGDGIREMIVSWQMGTKIYQLAAYEFAANEAVELMSTSYNERYLVVDMDDDGCRELVVFQRQVAEGLPSCAEYYRYQDGVMTMNSSAPLSADANTVAEARTGRLKDGVNGIYVRSEPESGARTDILVLTEGGLKNVTLDSETGVSQSTHRLSIGINAADINRDGVLELPLPVLATSMEPDTPSSNYITYWRQFDSQGVGTVVSATYHSVLDGWYFVLPTNWIGKITVARDDSRGNRGERAVVFYYWPDTETTTPAPFLTIYRLTGDNRYSRARLSGRVTLLTDSSAIYSASLNTDVWDCGLEAADLIGQFSLITPEWSTQ